MTNNVESMKQVIKCCSGPEKGPNFVDEMYWQPEHKRGLAIPIGLAIPKGLAILIGKTTYFLYVAQDMQV